MNDEQKLAIEQALRTIEDIICEGRLPNGRAGELMSLSLEKYYDKLSNQLKFLQAEVEKKAKDQS